MCDGDSVSISGACRYGYESKAKSYLHHLKRLRSYDESSEVSSFIFYHFSDT